MVGSRIFRPDARCEFLPGHAPQRCEQGMSLAKLISSGTFWAPALITWVLWACVLTIHQVWAVTFGSYWSMSVALIFGSLVAGSTPVSAGVVIYPVTQLAPLSRPPDPRDVSVLLQAIGLAAATYTIILRKPELLHGTRYLLFFFCVFVRIPGLEPWTCTAHSAADKSCFRTPAWTGCSRRHPRSRCCTAA